ncbi:MAG: BMP family ABC transporter substrate-binding protein [Acidobacteria bacterium]|nr:BMP family ABC transporter substrate-binding protein [Acidobacteriota bacterium]
MIHRLLANRGPSAPPGAKRPIAPPGAGALLALAVAALTACSTDAGKVSLKGAAGPGHRIKAGLVSNIGGFGDKSYADLQYNGLVRSRTQFGIDIAYEEVRQSEDYADKMEKLIHRGCNLIFCSSVDMQPAVEQLAPHHPQVRFVLLDAPVIAKNPNTVGVLMRQSEGCFLVGALAARMSRSGTIAAVCGRKEPVIDDFTLGFEAGARLARPDIRVKALYLQELFPGKNPWSSPVEAKQAALDLVSAQGADVVFGIAGASNLGIFQACKEKKVWAIGVDSDQDYLVPRVILCSMMKRMDQAILLQVERVLRGRFESGNITMGLSDGGVDVSPMTYTRGKVPPDVLRQMQEFRAGIVSGAIQVPSTLTDTPQVLPP